MVTVSTADFSFSKDVSNWMTTYSPSGAPGSGFLIEAFQYFFKAK